MIEKDSALYRVKELYNSYKKDNKKIDKSKIIIKDTVIGIVTSIDIAYSKCHRTELISPSDKVQMKKIKRRR